MGKSADAQNFAAMNLLMLQGRNLFISDTYVNELLTPEQLADMTILAARKIERFGSRRRALVSNSNFGSVQSARRASGMAEARKLIAQRAPNLEVDGEMHADAALSETVRKAAFPGTTLTDEANLLTMPNVEAASG